jgi:hypothetical protein
MIATLLRAIATFRAATAILIGQRSEASCLPSLVPNDKAITHRGGHGHETYDFNAAVAFDFVP